MSITCSGRTARSGLLSLLVVGISLVPIYFFVTGYFTSKVRFEDKSTCELKSKFASEGGEVTETGCIEPKFRRAIFILIDALRYDFSEANEAESLSGKPYFYGKLDIFDKYERLQDGRAKGFKLIADPPTTTYQRLQGILAGTIPTFVEAGSNFFAPETIEDNLLYQIKSAGAKTVVLGDDTWGMLFPDFLSEKTQLYPSLDTTDIDTVDNGILSHLSIIHEGLESWKLLVLHFLGVDHVGHTYGPDHPEMERKLRQLNSVIETVIEAISDDTVVFVFGDHGMDSYGGHGGDSQEEVTTFLFAYSKSYPIFSPDNSKLVEDYLLSLEANSKGRFSPETFYTNRRAVSQVDILPTVSLLLGIPIPYSNLGSVIPEFFIDQSDSSTFKNLATIIRINSFQIHKYAEKYTRKVMSIILNWSTLQANLDSTEMLYNECLEEHNIEACRASALQFTTYNKTILASARKSWSLFNNKRINSGITLGLFSIVICVELLMVRTRFWRSSIIWLTVVYFMISESVIIMYNIRIGTDNILQHIQQRLEDKKVTILIMLATILSGIIANFSPRLLKKKVYQNCRFSNLSCKNLSFSPLCALILYSIFTISLRSNSYIVFEDTLTMYILQTLNFFMIVTCFKSHSKVGIWNYVMLIVAERFKNVSRICREEHGSLCTTTFYALNTNSVSPIWLIILRALLNLIVIRVQTSYFKNIAALNLSKPFLVAIGSLEVLSSLYYIIETLSIGSSGILLNSNIHSLKSVLPWVKVIVADIIFISQLSLLVSLVVMNFLKKNSKQPISEMISSATKYYKFFLIIWSIVLLVQKPTGGIVLGITLFQIMILLNIFVNAEDKDNLASIEKSCPPQPSLGITKFLFPTIYLYLLSWNTFYTTGHQATLASIHWNSAFIGLMSLNWIVSPILVIMNTFGGHILIAFSVPLFLLCDKKILSYTTKQKIHMLVKLLIIFWLFNIFACFMTMLHTSDNKRSLFAWKIFAPKFIMIGASTLISYMAILLSFLLALSTI